MAGAPTPSPAGPPAGAPAGSPAESEDAHRQGSSQLRRAALVGVVAVIVLVVGSGLGGLGAVGAAVKLTVAGLALVFVVLGILATRSAARGIGHLAAHTSPAAGAGSRLLIQLTGYVMVLVGALGLLAVPLERLLVGGALTGVVVGIAAQQPLSNLVAGLVLLVARPVTVGSRIQVHSGALAGPFEGTISDVGLIYTTLDTTEQTVLRLPNAGLLASALHTLPACPDEGTYGPTVSAATDHDTTTSGRDPEPEGSSTRSPRRTLRLSPGSRPRR